MLDPLASHNALLRLFRREPVVDIDRLFGVLDTRSRMSVFRRLKPLGYLSSFTHNGRYYTLVDLARFDAEGIWFHRGVGFSRAGTLKAAVVQLVESSEAGRTHPELRDRVRVRVHNTLLDLVRSKRIRRDLISGQHLYLSAEQDRASVQLARRHELMAQAQIRTWEPPPTLVIEVLCDVLKTARLKVDAQEITSRLRARRVAITLAEVERILDICGIKKKGARRRSRRSKQ